MVICFDCEFTGLHKNTTLVSIGLVGEDGNCFYAEFTDYDNNQVDSWIQENVIDNLTLESLGIGTYKLSKTSTVCRGSKAIIRKALLEWLDQYEYVLWVSDVCHYDFVLLIDLLYDTALNIPDNHSKVCYDITNYIADMYNLTPDDAFNKSREDILKEHDIKIPGGDKHNALYDAKVIAEIIKL